MDKRWVKFPEVLFFQEGPGVRNTQYTSEGVKLLNVANLVNGKVDISNSDRFISRDEAYGKYKHFLCDNGDFIVASSGIKVEYIDKKMGFIDKSMLPLCMNTSTIRFKVLNSKELNIKYFMYYLKSRHFKLQLAKQITGSAQLNYGPSHLKDMCLPMVDIYIQNNIVEILDKIHSIINICEAKIEKLDILVRARFVEMFGEGLKDDGKFKLKPISRIGQVVSGATPKTSRHEYWNGNNVWITPAELSDESFVIYNSERKLTYEGVDSCAVNLLPVGTVILSSRAPIGKVAIAGVEMYCNQGFKNIIPRDEISSIYLYELLKMETEYLNSLGRGATFKEISKQIVENIRVKVPPIELQNQFDTFIEQVNKSKVEVQKALDKARLLFDSLMQKYFG